MTTISRATSFGQCLALAGQGLRDARVRAPGFQRYLTKPVDGDELRAAVLEQFHR